MRFFQYFVAIRKLIYMTNTVEGYHRQIRKITKNKGVFPNGTDLFKLFYLAYRNVHKKWTIPISNRGIISQQLTIQFVDTICCKFITLVRDITKMKMKLSNCQKLRLGLAIMCGTLIYFCFLTLNVLQSKWTSELVEMPFCYYLYYYPILM